MNADTLVSGFLLSREWHDRRQGSRLVLWAATDRGPMKLVVENIEPVMFLRRSQLQDAAPLLPASARLRKVAMRALDGEPVEAVYCPTQQILETSRDNLTRHDIECLEADIRPGERFLMERFIRGAFQARGAPEQNDGFSMLTNPKLRAAEFEPHLTVLSLDIETTPDARRVYSIAAICGSHRRVLMSGSRNAKPGTGELDLVLCADEREMLEMFFHDIKRLDPDVLVGWNVINFDLTVLQQRGRALGVPFKIGRDNSPARILPGRANGLNAVARIPGRVVLDGIEGLRSAFWMFESYSLETVARELLGRGKTIAGKTDKTAEITRLYEHDKPALARYNLEDCQLVLDIFEETDLLAFVIERSRLTGLAMGRQGGSVAAFDFLYLPRLHREGRAAPSLASYDYAETSPGGYVLDSVPGIHENVAVLDFKSLYPSIIRTFKVDPLGRAQPGSDPVPGFQGAVFSRDRNILPSIIEELWQRRDEAKRAGNRPLDQAIKILMNSFYGVLGTDGCRFYHPQLASSITRRGHQIIRTSRDQMEEHGFRVIYGDTDSLFVLLKNRDDPGKEALQLVEQLNVYWERTIRDEYGLPSYLEIELDTIFGKFFMPKIRGRDTGSKKRYAGLTGADGDTLVIKGLEAVRSDWTAIARRFQRELLLAVLRGIDPESLVRSCVEQVRAGCVDSELVYRKRLRRPLDAYIRNVPPHVKAARMLDDPGGEVSYLITVSGPQPVEKIEAPLDREHYVERQLKPIADAILPLVGLDFDRIAGGQGDLFA